MKKFKKILNKLTKTKLRLLQPDKKIFTKSKPSPLQLKTNLANLVLFLLQIMTITTITTMRAGMIKRITKIIVKLLANWHISKSKEIRKLSREFMRSSKMTN
jgi:hypothetical protein